MEKRLKIAFVCVHNSCRSQIAEALGKKLMNDKYEFYSCGTVLKKSNQSRCSKNYERSLSNRYGKRSI